MSTLCDATAPMVTVPRTSWVMSSTATLMSLTAASAAFAYGSTASPAAVSRTARRERSSKWLAQFAFQPLDLCTDRRLRDVNALGGTGEVRFLGDGDEVFQLSEFHKR